MRDCNICVYHSNSATTHLHVEPNKTTPSDKKRNNIFSTFFFYKFHVFRTPLNDNNPLIRNRNAILKTPVYVTWQIILLNFKSNWDAAQSISSRIIVQDLKLGS